MLAKLKKSLSSGEEIGERLVRPFQRFAEKEAASSILLLGAAVVAIVWANSCLSYLYHTFWHTELSLSVGPYSISKSLFHWINDGLMAFFFFTVGLEIKQEMLVGELASFRKAFLPAANHSGLGCFPGLL